MNSKQKLIIEQVDNKLLEFKSVQNSVNNKRYFDLLLSPTIFRPNSPEIY